MDEARRLSIAAALERYRETVRNLNIATMRVMVDVLAAYKQHPLSPSIELNDLGRVRWLSRGLQNTRIKQAKDLEQVFELDVFEGVDNGPVVSRQDWFAAIAAELDMEFPPPDLEYLCTLTNYIQGPGLGMWQWIRQIDLLSADLDNPTRRIFIRACGGPVDNYLDGVFEDIDELKAGVVIGENDTENWGGTWILYCLKDGVWAWRYALMRNFWGRVFDSLEDFMDFYATYDTQPVDQAQQDARKFTRIY